jgi:XTP/dITP diphosphohydrolase
VFGDVVVADADEVSANWERIKAGERRTSGLLDGVPAALPALVRAQKAVRRAGRAGLAPPAPSAGGPVGERLLALVAEAAAAGLDAEGELRRALAQWERACGPGAGDG